MRPIHLLCLLLSVASSPLTACTNLIVTKQASTDQSVMMTYAADSHIRYGYLFFWPSADHPAGAVTDIIHYENGKLMGQIPEVAHTYNVVGLMNEYQVACGESTWGGLDSLQKQPGAVLDYGSLMRLALQRAKTAREAIRVMSELVAQYGYASSGESITVTDKNEAWILEIIGKGGYEKGAVWVAVRIPDGYVSAHANQARITTFVFQKKNDWNNLKQEVYHSPDVISFARKQGFYKGTDDAFSFSDVYNPVNFGGARFCDARVWSFFRRMNAGIKGEAAYTDYALGKLKRDGKLVCGGDNPNGYVSNRLPLWVKPDRPVSLQDLMDAMRDHYEDTPLDMRDGVGAGPYHCPYRWRPMEFTVDSVAYLHERAIATQQTGYVFVAQSRSHLPDPAGGIFWFGVDDADGCVFAPMYCGIRRIPSAYAQGNGSMIQWSDSSAFWTFSMVNNLAYSRYDRIHPEIEQYQKEYQNQLFKAVEMNDKWVKQMNTEQALLEIITAFSVMTGNQLVKDWKVFFQYLFMKHLDGNQKKTEGMKLLDNGNGKGIPPKPTHPGYGMEWERLMIQNTGDRYRVK